MQYAMHHIALSVANRERSVAFYAQLGFKEVQLWEAEDQSLTITHLHNGGFILELFCYTDAVSAPDSIHALATDLPVIGTKHFGLRVESIEQAREDLVSKGIIDNDVQITQGRTGPRYIFIADPDGILVEISEDPRTF